MFIPTDSEGNEINEMLKNLGFNSFEELIAYIPKSLRLQKKLDIPPPQSEMEMLAHVKQLAKQNKPVSEWISFLGAGAYDHFVPAIIDAIASRSEFYTAYTPYQAEVAQGTLQVMYEFQSMIAEISGMDVANASLYDGSTALAEAMLVSVAHHQQKKMIIAGKIHPYYLSVLQTYAKPQSIQIIQTNLNSGTADLNHLQSLLKTNNVSAVIFQQPNFYGMLEDSHAICKLAKDANVLAVASTDPISLGILEAPGNYNADIVVGEGQALGCMLNFGGPYLGFYATKKELIRTMPGRLSGITLDSEGKHGFILTLQTREQHIKRDKATSNICTSQTLLALRATIYLAIMGKHGFHEVATHCYKKAHFLANQLTQITGIKLKYNGEFFKEFVLQLPKSTDIVINQLRTKGILAGVNLAQFGEDGLLVAVTEKRTKAELDFFVNEMKSVLN